LKVVTVIGTRPDIIKAALRRPLFEGAGIHEVLVHTGQHFDQEMSGSFFEDLGIQRPTTTSRTARATTLHVWRTCCHLWRRC